MGLRALPSPKYVKAPFIASSAVKGAFTYFSPGRRGPRW
ncbi:hypothetical protein SAMN04489733_7647 [Amycolatopsis keratiniphila]|nr:hypothetical protein SAMN04489733_7647 [Amycolatopsis keratiniphila]